MESFCSRFTQLAQAHKPVICENSERAGAKYRHRGVVECTEVWNYPNSWLNTPGTQSILLSHGHQRGNVWLTEKRRISKEKWKLYIFEKDIQSRWTEVEMSWNLIRVFAFDLQRCFNAVNPLLRKKQVIKVRLSD